MKAMSIRVLSEQVISKIAAGEVVERPASVVKELIENSLDAGATRISVEASGGGTQLIRVSDNGLGISEGDIGLAFTRHATSKITSEVDIESISSLGFRGEALPTIASVADVSVLTRYHDEEVGTAIELEGGTIVSKTPQGCSQGTTIAVSNLFRNVPARLKFLKSVSTESSHISQIVTHHLMAFPEVKFTLVMNGRTVLRSPGNGSLRDAIVEVYGLETGRAMLEVPLNDGYVNGFVSPSSVSRSNRNYLSFFVNRRWVQSRMLNFAAEEAYQNMLMVGKHPVVVLNIWLPPAEVDVNVHPTKREIKFRDERGIFSAVQKAVRETLVGFSPVPSMRPSPALSPSPVPVSIPFPATAEMQAAAPDLTASQRQTRHTAPQPAARLPIMRVIGQLHNSYVLAEGPDGIYIVDQHAAHERIRFEKIRREQENRNVEVQGLLEPMSIDLTAQQAALIDLHRETLAESGFTLEQFGERTCLLRAVPAFLNRERILPVLQEILDFLAEAQRSDWQERIAASLACHGAIKAGQVLEQREMEELLRQLEEADSPRTCPHGRPTMIQISIAHLEKEFGR
ncbi:MAG: DNA mismatch repair endonuclease MutL [Dehalococcoidia bacterium]